MRALSFAWRSAIKANSFCFRACRASSLAFLRSSNLSFEVKRDRKDKKDNYIGFKNGLYLNRELATLDAWTIEHIKKRTTFLVEKAKRLFEIVK